LFELQKGWPPAVFPTIWKYDVAPGHRRGMIADVGTYAPDGVWTGSLAAGIGLPTIQLPVFDPDTEMRSPGWKALRTVLL
jgi:hypothetical protein